MGTSSDNQAKELRLYFCKYKQEHVFKFWEILSEQERANLIYQAKALDLEYLSAVINNALHRNHSKDTSFAPISPAKFIKYPNSVVDWQKWKDTIELGENIIRAGKVAAFTAAGGEGTRLGYSVPKGMLSVTPIKHKSLFQIFAEKIRYAEHKYDVRIPWIVMTSEQTHNETIEFFGKNDSFGVEDLHFIKQGQMPAISYDGKIIMETRSKIAMHPDGHGGSLKALGRSGMLAMLEERGIEILSFFQVDNPLVRCIDPYLIGLHVQNKAQVSSRMVKKLYPEEKVGVFCEQNGRCRVIEYTDLPREQAVMRDSSGNLVFCSGNIGVHLLDVRFMKQFNGKNIKSEISYHIAKKVIPTIDNFGECVTQQSPNGLKLEMFIFDAFPRAEKTIIVESKRLSNFSPIKNREGLDSMKTCLHDQLKLCVKWLQAAGADIPSDANGVPPFDVEISPLFADNKYDFVDKWSKLQTKPVIAAGQYIE